MMYCEKCGNEISESVNFCSNCGNKIPNDESVEAFVDSIVKENNFDLPWEVKSKKRVEDSDFIDAELEKAEYKLDNGDVEGAEKIFEELALRYDEPRAWQSIGEIKFKQLESGKATVAQALNCFIKSVNPLLKVEDESKKQTQKVFEGLALSYAMDFTPKIWKIKEKTFKNKKDKELLWFYETTKWELFQAVNNFCFDNKEVYSEFLNTLKKFSPSGFLKKGTSLVSSTGYDMLTTDMYASMRAEAKQRVEKMWKEAKDNLKNSI